MRQWFQFHPFLRILKVPIQIYTQEGGTRTGSWGYEKKVSDMVRLNTILMAGSVEADFTGCLVNLKQCGQTFLAVKHLNSFHLLSDCSWYNKQPCWHCARGPNPRILNSLSKFGQSFYIKKYFPELISSVLWLWCHFIYWFFWFF